MIKEEKIISFDDFKKLEIDIVKEYEAIYRAFAAYKNKRRAKRQHSDH